LLNFNNKLETLSNRFESDEIRSILDIEKMNPYIKVNGK